MTTLEMNRRIKEKNLIKCLQGKLLLQYVFILSVLVALPMSVLLLNVCRCIQKLFLSEKLLLIKKLQLCFGFSLRLVIQRRSWS